MKRIAGEIEVAPDKSISHRALMIASIARGKSRINNFLRSDDCLSTMSCLKKLGAVIEDRGGEIIVDGKGPRLTAPDGPLYAGNSGTTVRLLSGILAGQNFKTTLTGDESLSKRPMNRVALPLSMMGAKVDTTGGKLPITVEGGKLKGIDYSSEISSAQVKSCVLMAALYADGKTVFAEPRVSRDHTERMLAEFGAKIETQPENCRVAVEGPSALAAKDIAVPGDISSAAFFMVAAAILPESGITVKNVGVNPTRTGIIDVLKRMGAKISVSNSQRSGGEPAADISVSYSGLKAVEIHGDEIPLLIDELPVIAVAAACAHGITKVRGARELRVKETDRIKAVVSELTKMGIAIKELDDGFEVEGPSEIRGAKVETYGDHRMAMSLAVAAMAANGPTKINGFECAAVSFPGFGEILEKISS